jgi:hypothetical protein
MMSQQQQQQQQQQLLRQKLTIPQILREYGRQFTQIKKWYSDRHNGRCAIGVIMSYYNWNGKDDSDAPNRLLDALVALGRDSISENLIIQLNDSGATFDEIADYLDRIVKSH